MLSTSAEISIPSRGRAGLYTLVICVWAIVFTGMFYLVAKPVREPSLDFFPYYIAASALHQGEPVYTFSSHESVAAATGTRFSGLYQYPPTFLILMQPLLLLSPYAASLVWFGINVGLLLLGVALLFKQSNLQNHQMGIALRMLPILFVPVLVALYLGSVNFLMLVLVVLAYQAFVGGRPYASGLLLALSTWIKVWPLILIAYFCWKREWKVVSAAVIGSLVIGALTVALAGVGPTTSFFTERLPQITSDTYPGLDHLNQSIPGIFAKMFAPSSRYVQPLIISPTVAQLGSRIATFLLIVTTVLLCSRPVTLKDRKQFSTEFTLVIIASLLIGGGRTWDQSLVLLLPAYFFIAEEFRQEQMIRWRQVALPVASIILINLQRVLWTVGNADRLSWPWFLLIFPFLGLMVLWLVFVSRRVQEIKNAST